MDYSLAPRASGPVSWLETILVTGLAIGLGFWLTPEDPLQMHAGFPWPILAPLLLGVRYGFVRGLFSAGLLVAALFALLSVGSARADLAESLRRERLPFRPFGDWGEMARMLCEESPLR